MALISAGGCCGQPADAQTTDEPLVVTVTADRPDALYLNGETAAFTIEVTRGGQRADRGEVEVWLSQDGNPTKLEKKRFTLSADAPVRVSGAVDEPAFLLCQTWASVGSAKAYGEKMVWYRGAADTTKTSVELVTDREDALYRCGKLATFSARVTKDGQRVTEGYLEFALAGEIRGQPTARQVLDLAEDRPLTISGTLDEPGFLYCQVRVLKSPDERLPSYRWDTFTSVGFDVEKLRSQSVLPEDFEASWRDTLAESRKLTLDVELEKLDAFCNARADYYRFSVATLNGERAYGFMGIPRGPGPFPAIAFYPSGSGPGYTAPSDIGLTSRGAITLMMNVGNYSKPQLLAGFARALDYVRSRDDWDGKHLVVAGVSRGGGLSVTMAGLCADMVTGMVAGVPGGGHYSMHFAHFIRCSALVSVGFRDGSCTAPMVFAMYNAIQSKDKKIVTDPREGHTTTPYRQGAERAYILRELGFE